MSEQVQYSKLHHRYALALCNLAKETNKTVTILKEVDEIINMYDNDAKFDKICKSPLISSKKQMLIIRSIFTKGNEAKIRVSNTIYSFLLLLSKNSRLSILRAVLMAFKNMVSLDNKEIEVNVTSAVEIEKGLQNDLKTILEKQMGKKINLTNYVDKSIIGGLVLQIGSDLIDISVKNKIFKINNMIKEAI